MPLATAQQKVIASVALTTIEEESLVLNNAGTSIRATFDPKDFSQGLGLTYQAGLHRDSGSGPISSVTVSYDSPVATFDVEDIPQSLRSSEFSVRVMMCVTDVSVRPNVKRCGRYGSDGGTTLKLPPAPTNFSLVTAYGASVKVSWTTVSGTVGYEFDYRKQGTTTWLSRQGSVSSSPALIPSLDCNTTYEIKVRAYGDGTTYSRSWGYWTPALSVRTAATSCSSGSSSGQSGAGGTSGASGDTILFSWSADPEFDYYILEIAAIEYLATIDGGETEHRVPTSLLSNLRGEQTASVWKCHTSGPCGLHKEITFQAPQ